MAPEQTEKPTEVDHRADIYSLGVVLYQMLTGELPGKRIEPPSKKVQLDVRLDEVVLRALEREPERRYQQASQVKTDVETIASGIPVSDAQDSKARQEELPRPPDGWRTWIAFRQQKVMAVYSHMTDAEKREDLKQQVVGALGTLLGAFALVFLHDLLPEGHRAVELRRADCAEHHHVASQHERCTGRCRLFLRLSYGNGPAQLSMAFQCREYLRRDRQQLYESQLPGSRCRQLLRCGQKRPRWLLYFQRQRAVNGH